MASATGRVALITGASSAGIGRACAVAFAEAGYAIAATGRNPDGLQETKKLCCEAGLSEEKVLTIEGEISDEEDVKRILATTIEKFAQLNVLINNAGFSYRGRIEEVSLEDWDKQMNVNLRSVFHLSKLAVPHLKDTKGCIINVSSNVTDQPLSELPLYCVSKAGLDMLTKCLALDLARYGIRVNSINPGITRTNIFKKTGANEDYVYKLASEISPLGRCAEPKEMASIVLFLASEASKFINGSNIIADGGTSINDFHAKLVFNMEK